jgi:class 3 adenylate cyclase
VSAATAIGATAPAKPNAPAVPKRRGLRISIRFKFAFFTVLLIAAVMGAVGYSLYIQQRQALSREVLGRGLTVAENLASASRDPLTVGETLDLAVLVSKAVEQGDRRLSERKGIDLRNTEDLLVGLEQAFKDLLVEVPRVLELNVGRLLGQPVNWGFAPNRKTRLNSENEGIVEAVIVDKDGIIAAHYRGSSELGQPYRVPRMVQDATVDAPYPIYELEVFEDGQRYTRRLFHLAQPVMQVIGDGESRLAGTVYLGVDEELVQRIIFEVTMKLAAIAITAVVAGLLLTYLVVSWLTAPIGRLVKGVLAIAGGDFNTRVKVASKDELGELTSAFNDMSVSLSQNEMLKGAFSRYVSDAALKQILADPGKTGLHSRRTLATIYTSDVRGFTAMSETLEPEQVVQVINTYLSLQTEIILRHGGQVDKFIGDATIGVWGKEEPGPDDAINAVRAAFEAQEAIDKLNLEREARGEVVKLIGIGINTGEVVSGNMGSSKKMEYTVTGEHVIFADQICAECPGGKVWISESTYALVKDKVLAEQLEMKSKSHGDHGVTVYQVNGFR